LNTDSRLKRKISTIRPRFYWQKEPGIEELSASNIGANSAM
jgi:hypothetical protein